MYAQLTSMQLSLQLPTSLQLTSLLHIFHMLKKLLDAVAEHHLVRVHFHFFILVGGCYVGGCQGTTELERPLVCCVKSDE